MDLEELKAKIRQLAADCGCCKPNEEAVDRAADFVMARHADLTLEEFMQKEEGHVLDLMYDLIVHDRNLKVEAA
jgi:hypothetical protein